MFAFTHCQLCGDLVTEGDLLCVGCRLDNAELLAEWDDEEMAELGDVLVGEAEEDPS